MTNKNCFTPENRKPSADENLMFINRHNFKAIRPKLSNNTTNGYTNNIVALSLV